MGEFNYFFSLRFGVVVFRIFTMLTSHSKEGGAQGGGLGKTELIPLPPPTALVPLVTGVEPSTPVLLILQGVRFAPYYTHS